MIQRRLFSGCRFVGSLVVVAVVALSALSGCGPSINAAAKADIDRRVAALKGSGASFPAPVGFVPMPLAVGQWTQHKQIDDKGAPSFMTYKILGEEGGAFWIETVMETYSGRTMQKMLIAFGSRVDVTQIEIRAVSTKDSEGRVNEMPASMMPMLQSLYKGIVKSLVINWQGLPQETATAPAGTFQSCFKSRTEVQWGTFSATSDGWAHPAVPISGMVRSLGVDKPSTTELVAFGLTGAKSEF